MNKLTLRYLEHRRQQCIAVMFEPNGQMSRLIKSIKDAQWSRTHKCWYTPLSRKHYFKLLQVFGDVGEVITTPLLDHFKKNPSTKAAVVNAVFEKETFFSNHGIHKVNARVLTVVKQHLQLKAYSESTIRTYLNELAQFLQHIKAVPSEEFSSTRLKNYFQYCYADLKLSENTMHSRMNALKFYYEQVLGREKFFWEIPRPKKPLLLPNVLGEKEISSLFKALTNKKHKAILFTAYSAGLRVSEVVSLTIPDIDSDRMQIKVVNAKGKKDRFVVLSPVVLDVLRDYIKSCRPRPKHYLFESENAGEPYSSRSAQKVFQRAKEMAGIKKHVSFHSLRHSFATHLLEKGVDIRYIKDLLGHFNIKTTERYTHVSKTKLVMISSPLDDLWLKGELG